MRLVNPLNYPLAILAGAGTLLGGVLVFHWEALPMTAAGLVVSGVAASLIQQLRERPARSSPAQIALEPDLQDVLTQAEGLAIRAQGLHEEASQRLSSPEQLELLGAILYACDRAEELPGQLRPVLESMQTGETVFSAKELQAQLREAEARVSKSRGASRESAQKLVSRLRQNLAMVEQGATVREARISELATAVAEAAGVLLSLQTRLREGNLKGSEEAQELKRLTEDFQLVQKSVVVLAQQGSSGVS